MVSKVFVASKRGPLEEGIPPLDLRKKFSKIRENFVSDPQLNLILV